MFENQTLVIVIIVLIIALIVGVIVVGILLDKSNADTAEVSLAIDLAAAESSGILATAVVSVTPPRA
jgi:hypothetical protein